jgi:hypothetical protein
MMKIIKIYTMDKKILPQNNTSTTVGRKSQFLSTVGEKSHCSVTDTKPK